MCGLFGVAGPGILQEDLRAFRELGLVSQFRGVDGAGVFEINTRNRKSNGFIYRTGEDFNYLTILNEEGKGKKFANDVNADFLMGHTRAATSGSIGTQWSHPFDFANLTGMHNGTLRLPKYLNKKDSDSYLMFKEMNERGPIPVLSELTDKCAYQITIFDKVKRQFIFANNGQRSLHFAINKKRNVLYWASEKSMLFFILGMRLGFECEFFNLQPGLWITSTSKIFSNNPTIFTGWTLEEVLANGYKPQPVPKEDKPSVEVPLADLVKSQETEQKKPVEGKIEIKEDNVIHAAFGRLFESKKEEVTKKDDVPWKERKETKFGTQATCCGKYLTPLEMYEFSQGRSFDGFYSVVDDEYTHFKCLKAGDVSKLPNVQ